jgi:hypothetical protein
MLTDAIRHLKEQFKNSLSKVANSAKYNAHKVTLGKEAISLLDKAEKLSQDLESDRKEINRLIARALILADNAGVFDDGKRFI